MSVVVEITNTENLKRAKKLLGAKSDGETLEFALEKVIEVCEPETLKPPREELPEEYWEDLFSEESILEAGETGRAVVSDREESRY